MPVFEWCNFGAIDPASAEPAESKYNFVQDDEDHGDPIGSSAGLVRRQCCDDDIDEHTDTAANGRPDHHSTATDFLDVPDWWVGSDSKGGVEYSSQDAGQ